MLVRQIARIRKVCSHSSGISQAEDDMMTYLLLSKDSTSCYALDITWENGKTCCRMNVDTIATGMTIDEVRANNSMM